ncbi:hypothetical protein VSDG_08742 [Cytospora chrysosperma]|uniref:Uncharacterized protein n=1 Tax=Cytospora chrysosperma TaxID=252740 RepID=A0A423VDT6_CYTCH|nr:hypothetical protein VSDG_08742 [Valsa sordida]
MDPIWAQRIRSRAAEQRLNSTQLNAQRYWLPTLAPRTSAKNRDADEGVSRACKVLEREGDSCASRD